MSIISSTSNAPHIKKRPVICDVMNIIILALSAALIVWISLDTFRKIDFLQNGAYMKFQLWVCLFFVLDFFVEIFYAENKWQMFRHRLLFLLLSIPYLNIINLCNIELGPDALYFVRFIPLARGALAMAIVISYLSSNAVTSLFMSYMVIMILVAYFCSLIFYQCEHSVNPEVNTYWTALWWSAMNMSTVGCNISPVTVAGKIVAVVLPVSGMVIFPLFTVYLTNYVTNAMKKRRSELP